MNKLFKKIKYKLIKLFSFNISFCKPVIICREDITALIGNINSNPFLGFESQGVFFVSLEFKHLYKNIFELTIYLELFKKKSNRTKAIYNLPPETASIIKFSDNTFLIYYPQVIFKSELR